MGDAIVTEHHGGSGRTALIADESDSIWLYLTEPGTSGRDSGSRHPSGTTPGSRHIGHLLLIGLRWSHPAAFVLLGAALGALAGFLATLGTNPGALIISCAAAGAAAGWGYHRAYHPPAAWHAHADGRWFRGHDQPKSFHHAVGDPMGRQIVSTSKAAKPPATYSQAVKAAGLVFVSGTAPADPATGDLVGETIQEQTRQCLTNIAAILLEAGSSLDRIVSATVILAEEEDFGGMNEEWVRWFPSNPPARQGAKLPVRVPGLKVSIAAIAEA